MEGLFFTNYFVLLKILRDGVERIVTLFMLPCYNALCKKKNVKESKTISKNENSTKKRALSSMM